MDKERVIAEIAKRQGILLHSDDPILSVSTMLDLFALDHEERERKLADRDDAILAEVRATRNAMEIVAGGNGLSDPQVDKLGQRVAAACQSWAGNMVRATQHKSLSILAAIGVGGALLMFGAGYGVRWWTTPTPPVLSCAPDHGGVSCGYWVTPPTEPLQTAEQPQTKTGRR